MTPWIVKLLGGLDIQGTSFEIELMALDEPGFRVSGFL